MMMVVDYETHKHREDKDGMENDNKDLPDRNRPVLTTLPMAFAS
jgi:hypothetical protein